MLLFVPPEQQAKVRETLAGLLHVPFRIDTTGSQIIYFQHEEDYSRQEQDRSCRVLEDFRELHEVEGGRS